MSLKTSSVSNPEPKLIKCKTCRQDIPKEKMFLHEGFCQRNNIFCEHCEKVFLKKDYDEHLKDLRNSINSAKSTDIDENEYPPVAPVVIPTVTTTINPSTVYKFVEMPLTEEYTINTPIVISETGNIVSSQNTNEFILPSLGINAVHDEFGINYEKYFTSSAVAGCNINYQNHNVINYNYANINSSNNNNAYIYNNNNYIENVFYNNNNIINNNINNFLQKDNVKKNEDYQKVKPKKEPFDSPKSSRPKRQVDFKTNPFPKDTPRRRRDIKIIKIEKKETSKSPIRLPKNKKIKKTSKVSPKL